MPTLTYFTLTLKTCPLNVEVSYTVSAVHYPLTVSYQQSNHGELTCHFNDLMPGYVIEGMVPGQVGGASIKALGEISL